MQTVKHQNQEYPLFQTTGNAARFIMPFALELCKGVGYDIGCNRAEWSFPGAVLVDPEIPDNPYNAHNLPAMQVDYIFSSHCLEHVNDWVGALDHWHTRLRAGGTLFLYLPHFDQTYWRPWHNRKHVNVLTAEILSAYLQDRGYIDIFTTGRDLNHSFAVVATKL